MLLFQAVVARFICTVLAGMLVLLKEVSLQLIVIQFDMLVIFPFDIKVLQELHVELYQFNGYFTWTKKLLQPSHEI